MIRKLVMIIFLLLTVFIGCSNENQRYELYLPSIEIDEPNTTQEEISEKLMNKFFKYYSSEKLDSFYRIEGYKINKIEITQEKNTGFIFTINYSVKVINSQSNWVAGNGILGDNNWVESKFWFVTVLKNGNTYKIDNFASAP